MLNTTVNIIIKCFNKRITKRRKKVKEMYDIKNPTKDFMLIREREAGILVGWRNARDFLHSIKKDLEK